MSDDRPMCQIADNGVIVVRASAWSKPLCQLVNSALGSRAKPPPAHMAAVFETGHTLEPQIEARTVRELGWKNSRHQEKVMLDILPGKVRIDGSGDWVAEGTDEYPDRAVMVDAKSASIDMMKVWQREGGWIHGGSYAWQGSVYSMASGMPLVWVVQGKDPDNPDVLDEDQPLLLVWMHEPLVDLAEMHAKAVSLHELITEHRIPACPTPPHYPCPFYYLHDVEDPEAGEVDDEIEKWGQVYAKARDLEKDAKADKDAARDKLLEILGDRNEARGWRWKVTREIRERKGRLDEAGICEALDLPDLESFRGPVSKSTVLNVKEI